MTKDEIEAKRNSIVTILSESAKQDENLSPVISALLASAIVSQLFLAELCLDTKDIKALLAEQREAPESAAARLRALDAAAVKAETVTCTCGHAGYQHKASGVCRIYGCECVKMEEKV